MDLKTPCPPPFGFGVPDTARLPINSQDLIVGEKSHLQGFFGTGGGGKRSLLRNLQGKKGDVLGLSMASTWA